MKEEKNTKRYTETKDWATGTLQKTVFTSEEYTSGSRPVTLVKSWMTKRGNFYFNKLSISVCICDTDNVKSKSCKTCETPTHNYMTAPFAGLIQAFQ
jgi:hypothetical protein